MAVCERQTDTRVVWMWSYSTQYPASSQTRSDAFAEIDLADVNRTEVAPSRCHTHTMVIMVRADPQLSYDLFDVFPLCLVTAESYSEKKQKACFGELTLKD